MKSRNQIDEKYKWDLELFKTEEEIERAFDAFEVLMNEIPKFYGKFNNKDKFFEYHNLIKEKFIIIGKLDFYLTNSRYADFSDIKILQLIERFEMAQSNLNQASSFVDSQLAELDEQYLYSLLEDPRAKDLNVIIKDLIKNKKHQLDEKSNEIISKLSNSFNNSYNIFSTLKNSEIQFTPAEDKNKKKHIVNHETIPKLYTSKDRVLRKNTYNSVYDSFKQYNKTLSQLYIDFLKGQKDFCRLYNYTSILEEKLEDEKVPYKIFENNLNNINKFININKEIYKIRKIETGIKDFSVYDTFQTKSIGGKISIEKAKDIIISALSPLGSDYLKLLSKKFNDKSIDFLPNKHKYNSAYCSDIYACKSVILMNWSYKFYDVSDLAHELGHAVNAEFYLNTQPYEKANTTIFASEIASTVNEILLNNYMLNTCKKRDRKYYLYEFLSFVSGAIFTQTLYTEFEHFAISNIENDKPLTYEDLNKKYLELENKYFKGGYKIQTSIQYHWSRIHHFYLPYYVFSYSTGMITAICIANRILKDKSFQEKYIKFLKNGLSNPAHEVLKDIGIDLTTDSPFEEAFKFIKTRLNEYKNEIMC